MPHEGFERIELIMTGVSDREHSNSKTRHHEALVGKRIALFTGAYNYISDGVTLTLNRLVTYLERHGAETLIFSPTTKNPPPIKHAGTLVSVPSIPFPGRADYRLAIGLPRKARARLKAFDPDLISYWAFDEGSGTNATDTVGTNDGTLLNMGEASWVQGQLGLGLAFGPFEFVVAGKVWGLHPGLYGLAVNTAIAVIGSAIQSRT